MTVLISFLGSAGVVAGLLWLLIRSSKNEGRQEVEKEHAQESFEDLARRAHTDDDVIVSLRRKAAKRRKD